MPCIESARPAIREMVFLAASDQLSLEVPTKSSILTWAMVPPLLSSNQQLHIPTRRPQAKQGRSSLQDFGPFFGAGCNGLGEFAQKLQSTTRSGGLFRTKLSSPVYSPDFYCKAGTDLL